MTRIHQLVLNLLMQGTEVTKTPEITHGLGVTARPREVPELGSGAA